MVSGFGRAGRSGFFAYTCTRAGLRRCPFTRESGERETVPCLSLRMCISSGFIHISSETLLLCVGALRMVYSMLCKNLGSIWM